jgi:hypothetical protein
LDWLEIVYAYLANPTMRNNIVVQKSIDWKCASSFEPRTHNANVEQAINGNWSPQIQKQLVVSMFSVRLILNVRSLVVNFIYLDDNAVDAMELMPEVSLE